MLQDEIPPTQVEPVNDPAVGNEGEAQAAAVDQTVTTSENTLPVGPVSSDEGATPEGLDLDAIQADLEEIEQSMKQLRS